MDILWFLLTLIIATIGGLLGIKLKIPLGGMVGAMIFTVIANLFINRANLMPTGFNLMFQIPIGIMIGSRVKKEDIISLKDLGKPVIVIVLSMLILNIMFGYIIYWVTNLNLATAIFASAPGGMVDLTIVSYYFGATLAYVAVLQMFRNTAVMVFIAPTYRKILGKNETKEEQKSETKTSANLTNTNLSNKEASKRFFSTLVFALSFGLIFRQLGIPAGAIIGSMLGSTLYSAISSKAYFPNLLRIPTRIFAGTFIGMHIDRQSLTTMWNLIIPIIILFVYVWVVTYVTAFLVSKLTKLDFKTALLASTPGGMSEMAIIADELNMDSPQIAVMHTTRLISVIMLFPLVFSLLLQ